jgi:hypothetical protein
MWCDHLTTGWKGNIHCWYRADWIGLPSSFLSVVPSGSRYVQVHEHASSTQRNDVTSRRHMRSFASFLSIAPVSPSPIPPFPTRIKSQNLPLPIIRPLVLQPVSVSRYAADLLSVVVGDWVLEGVCGGVDAVGFDAGVELFFFLHAPPSISVSLHELVRKGE